MKLRRMIRVGCRMLGLVITLALSAAPVPGHALWPLPGDDPFYRYTEPLNQVAAGTVLRTRPVTVKLVDVAIPVTATQVLYRTTGQLGQPTVTVATVMKPVAAQSISRILSYQTAYDTLGAQCDPSYTLVAGRFGSYLGDATVMSAALTAGYTVVTSDYEGTEHKYGAYQESGYGTLDGIRAAEQALGADPATPVAMLGFSGGAIATEFAAELAPAYAPELRLAGAAAGGLPVNMLHNVDYIDGSPSWSKVTPIIMVGVSRAYGLDLAPYLSDYGKQVFGAVADSCGVDAGLPSGLTVRQLLRPEYADIRTVTPLRDAFDDMIMGSAGSPHAPLLLGAGNSDGVGDGVMITKDIADLARTYCARGVPVSYREYSGADHGVAGVRFIGEGMAYLTQRLDGIPAPNDCATMAVAN